MRQVKLAGRFDARQLADRQWLFDVAHNEQGMAFLLPQFEQLWQAHLAQYPHAKLHIVFSMLADKPIDAVVSKLVALPIDKWIVAAIDHPRAASLDELISILSKHISSEAIITTSDLTAAASEVIDQTQANDMIFVCGSFHTIGEVLSGLSVSAF